MDAAVHPRREVRCEPTARGRALAGADEILVADDVLSLPGAADLVAALQVERGEVELKGIA